MFNGQGVNPFLPSWEYIPDGEPHVFGDRVYVYGSHDHFNGYEFCPGDYVCYSAKVNDLTDWRYEGVIYGRTDDPRNTSGLQCLYAPDVTQGPDGRYYLYYCLNQEHVVSVAVCDTPAGRYQFLGYVHYADGTLLGEKEGDEYQFDPGVLTEGDLTYLYTGFAPEQDLSRSGSMCTVLGADMLTIWQSPKFIVPSAHLAKDTSFAEHPFFEASSIRKVDDTYYFVYSSIWNHEMCYATSKCADKDFTYRGVIISNIDMGIDTYKEAKQPMGYRDNNHGGFAFLNDRFYMFYHRHTNNYSFSRQACLEPIEILEDGSIPQVEMTSSGPNGKPLAGNGYYPAYIACCVYRETDPIRGIGFPGVKRSPMNPYLTQEGRDGDENLGYVENMMDGAIAGYKYFDCKNTKLAKIQLRISANYAGGAIEIASTPYGDPIATVDLKKPSRYYDNWSWIETNISLPDGKQAFYFRVKGYARVSLGGFVLMQDNFSTL